MNKMDKNLIPGFPFVLNLTHFDAAKTCKQDELSLIVERIKIKDKDKPLTYTLPIYKLDDNTYFVNITQIFKENEIYNLRVSCDQKISNSEITNLSDFFNKDNYILNEFLLEIFKELSAKGFSTENLDKVLNEYLPTAIENKSKKYNQNYYFRDKIYAANFYSAFSDVLGNYDNDKITVTSDDTRDNEFSIYKKYIDLVPSANANPISYEIFKNNLIALEATIINELKKVFKNVKIGDVLAASFHNKLSDRISRKVITHYGVGISSNYLKETYTYSNIGINYFFRPINPNYPISIHQGCGFGNRINLHISTTFFEIGPQLIDKKNRYGILNDQTITIGAGYLIDDGILINIGALLYNQAHSNPLITDQKLYVMPSISLNFDNALRGIFKSLKK